MLGSSVAFCDTGDIYNKVYDQSGEYSSRWFDGSAQLTPHWTPDGSHILFGYEGRIFVVDAAGSDLRSLSGTFQPAHLYSQTAEIDFSPTVSPDGTRVAYTTLRYATGELREHTYEIATQNIDGSDRRRLTNNSWNDVSPSWSPDGSQIAFVSRREDGSRVFTVTPDGSDERSIAPSVEAQNNAPVWSPDGSRLAFVGQEWESATLQYVDTYDSDNPVTETYEGTTRREAVYTAKPDGSGLRKLAWSETRDSAPSTRIGINEAIDPEEEVTTFQWSPNGKQVAFVAHYYGEPDGLYVANPDTSQVQQILELSTILEAQQYYRAPRGSQRLEGSIRGVAWSPGGSEIGFEIGGYRLYGDTIRPVSAVYTLSTESDVPPLLLEDANAAESYLEWPAVLIRRRPNVFREPLMNYPQSMDSWMGTELTRLVRYTEPIGLNPRPEVEGWVLSAIAWNGSGETVLVRIADDRLVPANLQRTNVAEDAAQCSDDSVVRNAKGNPGLVYDCRVLLEIRDTLAGDEVLYWNADSSITEWPGVMVDGSPRRVHAITSVPGVQLNGIIPPEISKLTELRVLNLEENELTGSLPPELGSLAMLEVLDVGDWSGGHNHLTGTIPPQVGSLTNLKVLDLSGNGLEGTIPPELGKLGSLEELYLGDNPLQGTIPPELGRLTNLQILYLGGHDNRLTGTIPAELGNLENLQELIINGTGLTGEIPPELGNLSQLRELHLRANLLNGPIPSELAKLKLLNKLYLEHNDLEGVIPPELGDLVEELEDGRYRMSLRNVDLGGNRLTGCVPAKLQHVWSIRVDLPLCE